jgi:hypothetical protein
MRLRDYCKKTQKWLACYRHLRWDVATPVGNAQGRRKEVARSFSLVLSFARAQVLPCAWEPATVP